jgi:predicted ATPase
LLVTSREALDVPGEWVRDVQGLGGDARDLFVQCAQRVRVGFAPAAEDERAIEHICKLVDGMALGVELAASWMRLLSCAEIADEIQNSLAFLSTNARQVPERHRSIVAVVEHSWGLLTDAERRALMHLTLFSGGFTREAASVVAGATLPLLSALVTKSLVRRVDARRFDLHELIRQFALERIENRTAAADAHANYFAAFAAANSYEALPTEHHTKFEEIGRERGNIETACAHLLASGEGVRAAHLLGSLLTLWLSEQNDTVVGLAWVARTRQQTVQSGVSLPIATQVELLSAQIAMLAFTADLTALADELERANTALRAQAASALHTLAYGQTSLAWVRIRQGRMDEARIHLEQAIPQFRRLGDLFGLAGSLRGLGLVLMAQQQFEASLSAVKECVAVSRKLNDPRGLAMALGGQAERERAQGELREAIVHYTESAQLFEALSDFHNLLMCKLNHLGAYVLLGWRDEADALARRITHMIAETNELPRGHSRAYTLLNFAGSELLVHDAPDRSATLLSASVAVLGKHGNTLQPADRRTFDHVYAQLKQRLPEDQLAGLWRTGETADDVILLQEALDRFDATQ